MKLINPRVINTRPAAQAAAFTKALQAKGYEVLEWPLVEIHYYPESDFRERFFQNFKLSNLLFITSQNAFKPVQALLLSYWSDRRADLVIYATGAKTARCIESAGFGPVVFPQEAMSSEGLLGLESLSKLQGAYALVIGAPGGRGLIQQSLLERGAEVYDLYVYERQMPYPDPNPAVIKSEDIVCCTSSESLSNLWAIFNGEGLSFPDRLKLLVSSERIAQKAVALGFSESNIIMAKNATDEALIKTLERKMG